MKDFSMYGDIVNYPSSLVMSGVESDAYFDIAVNEGIDRLLMSFHYIQRKGKNFLRDRLSKHPNIKMMIDSGAHTFHAKEEEFKDKPIEFWESYLERYVNFIKANKEFIFSCVELDIANIVGFEKVDYFRQKYFEPLKEEGILVCYVWHGYDGDAYWEEMCQRYDYIGFSLVNSSMDERDIIKKINTARKYGTLTHGFALTRVDILSKYPMWTADSTTWLVGTQYGELNWFDGRRMKRLKKDKWKKDYKQKYISIGANWDLVEEENPYELIRINLIVFLQAEEYIRKRIRAKSYWLRSSPQIKSLRVGKGGSKRVAEKKKIIIKPKKKVLIKHKEEKQVTGKQETTSLPKVAEKENRPATKFEEFLNHSGGSVRDLAEQISLIPDLDWFDTEAEDYKDVIKRLGINTNGNDKMYVLDTLYNITIFTRDLEIAESLEEDVIIEAANTYLNEDFDDYPTAFARMRLACIDNLTLKSNNLFPRGFSTNMEAIPKAKERENYLEDEEFELVDMNEEETRTLIGDMPEVEELDKELSQKGIVAVRDEKGRFLKGQKRVRKPKNIYSDKFPKLACDTCYKAGDCPEYQADSVCAYDKIFKKFDVRNTEDVADAISSIVNLNLGRMQRQVMFETMDGGIADGTVTAMIDQNINLLMKLKQLQENRIVATQHRTLSSNGDINETTVVNDDGGILSKIFGSPPDKSRDIVDVTPANEKEDIEEAVVVDKKQ